MKQVADRAGIAVQTVYRHFGSKDELVLAVLEESLAVGCDYISEVTDAITDPLDRLEQKSSASRSWRPGTRRNSGCTHESASGCRRPTPPRSSKRSRRYGCS